MAKRDAVLTGLVGFGLGMAVGANWKQLGKKAAPLLEKLGIQMSDLADFLSAITEEVPAPKPKKTQMSREPAPKKKDVPARARATTVPTAVHRNGKGAPVSSPRRPGKLKGALKPAPTSVKPMVG